MNKNENFNLKSNDNGYFLSKNILNLIDILFLLLNEPGLNPFVSNPLVVTTLFEYINDTSKKEF